MTCTETLNGLLSKQCCATLRSFITSYRQLPAARGANFKKMWTSQSKTEIMVRCLIIYLLLWDIYYYRLQRSWGKVMFSQACVILFTGGGGSTSVHAGIPLPWEQTPPWSRHTPLPQSILGDTVNARAVRILLECNLVRFVPIKVWPRTEKIISFSVFYM